MKESEQARAASLVIEATGWTPPTINRVLADVLARPLTWNLVVSNVPGPQVPFYLLGRRMLEVYPFVPLSPQGHALSLGVVSYDGGVFFGLDGRSRPVRRHRRGGRRPRGGAVRAARSGLAELAATAG